MKGEVALAKIRTASTDIFLVQDAEEGRVRVYVSDGYIYEYDTTPLLKAGGLFRSLRDPVTFHSMIAFRRDEVIWLTSDNRTQCPVIPLDTILRDGQKCPLEDDEVSRVLLRAWRLEREDEEQGRS
jgi:hypothetical protein